MAFRKRTWKDRLVEYAGRRKITNVSTLAAQIIDVERAEGIVSEEGSAFSAANMNDLEQRIDDGFAEVNSDLDAMNDGGAITGMDAREDGVYITYVPTAGADAVTKKLGSDITIVVQALANVDNTGESNTPAKSTLTITIRDGQVVNSSMNLDNADWSGRVRVHAMSVVSVVQD